MSVQFTGVYKEFGNHAVLSHVTLAFHANKLYTLLGESGAGKTTLLRLVAGLETPDKGVVDRYGQAVSYAFQEPRLFAELTVRENIFAISPKRSVDEILECLRLTNAADKYPRELSGGMKKRVGVARALAADADIYLLDEPTGGQDEMHAALVAEAIMRYTRGAVVIIATHDDQLRAALHATPVVIQNGRCTIMNA